MMENCEIMMWLFFEFFQMYNIVLVEYYLEFFCQILESVGLDLLKLYQIIVVLILGIYNLVYFEYVFLVDFMGVELVEGCDLFVDVGKVFMCMM